MLGIDIVYLPEFETRMKDSLLDAVFLSTELSQNKTQESLAGIFAAKEAFFKAIGRKEDWLSVWIEKNPPSPKASTDAKAMADKPEGQGKPQLYSTLIKNNQEAEVSISHAGDYAIAIVMINDKG